MPTGSKSRIFEQCGPFNPLLAEYDLDTEAGWVRLEPPIFHQEANGRFVFPEDSPFQLMSGEFEGSQFEATRGVPVQVAIRAADIVAAARRGETMVQLYEMLTLFRSAQPIKVPIHAHIRPYRSGPPRPEVRIRPIKTVDLAGELPPDGHLLLGQIELAPDQLPSIESRGHAQFSTTVAVTLDGINLPAGFRRHHRGGDERDRGWLRTDEKAVEWLEFDASLAGVTIRQLDYAIPYEALRQQLASLGGRRRETSSLSVEVWVDMILASDGAVTPLEHVRYNVGVVGSPTDTVSFSGLCGSLPRRVALTRDNEQTTVYRFPRVRVRRGRDSRLIAEPIKLVVTSDSSRLEVEVTATLRSQRLEWIALQEMRPLPDRLDTEIFQILLNDVLQQARPDTELDERLAIEIVAKVYNQSETESTFSNTFSFLSEIESGDDLPNWLCCVDFGTSSTAICIVNTTPLSQGYQLALGDWLQRIDPFHPESTVWLNSKATAPLAASRTNEVSYLLPSNIGLSSDLNLRADFDPLSMGNLQLSLPGAQGAGLRLAALDRTYDVSMPFPSTTLMAQYAGVVITEPKKRMIMRSEYVALAADVPERDAHGQITPVRQIKLAKLVEDCFDELGGYTVQSILSEDAADAPNSVAREIEQARLDSNVRFGAIVTHPSGIDQARRDTYRRAGQRFLRAFCGDDRNGPDDVILVAEALAAARYGIDDFLDQNRAATSVAQNFVTLDIGAGTYDVTTINYAGPDTDAWQILNHFGLALGGNDLDRLLMGHICGILQRASGMQSVLEQFQIDSTVLDDGDGDPVSVREHPVHRRLKLEFQGAKARLTRLLLDPGRENYRWPTKSEGGPPLDIKVGEVAAADASPRGASDTWAVRPRRSQEVSCEIMPGAELSFERDGDKPSVRLRLWRDAFEAAKASADDALGVMLAMMGEELPNLALGEVASSRGASTVVIVTGRAALWPLLYERIEGTVARNRSLGVKMARLKPFTPERMKQAVVRGAVNLTPEWREAESTVDNPIAIITFKADVHSTDALGPNRAIDTVTLLVDHRMEGQRDGVITKGPFIIARIIPGLDRREGMEDRLRLFRNLYAICRVKPFVELTRELNHPGSAARAAVSWRVRWRRDALGLRLTFDSGTEPIIEFGPFGGGRVYGPQ